MFAQAFSTCILTDKMGVMRYQKLCGAGLSLPPPEDHPWGDRSFTLQDPNGVTLYVYSEREAAHKLQPFYRNAK